MRFVPTALPGVVIVEPDVYRDGRGYFLETYHAERYRAAGIDGPFVQDNHSRSLGGTVRGLHLQLQRPQGKLIRVLEGEIYDVAVLPGFKCPMSLGFAAADDLKALVTFGGIDAGVLK